jgi:hypothetical protein
MGVASPDRYLKRFNNEKIKGAICENFITSQLDAKGKLVLVTMSYKGDPIVVMPGIRPVLYVLPVKVRKTAQSFMQELEVSLRAEG